MPGKGRTLMTNFAILTDSCSDLTAPLRERFGVDGYVPGALVYPDGSNHYADLDWKNMTPAQFFGTMKDKKGGLFTSAQIGLQDVADRFEPLLQQGRDWADSCLRGSIFPARSGRECCDTPFWRWARSLRTFPGTTAARTPK